ncbi:hypothetical protein G9A89_008442, partial [Geosiphon pyriformis]
ANSHGVAKTINFLFVSSNLVNAVVNCNVCVVEEFFDTDHWAVFVSVGLEELLDVQLIFIHKQANKNWWKFDFKEDFKNATLANAKMFSNEFVTAIKLTDLDAVWDVLRKIMTLLASEIFRKKWFKNFDSVFTKVSSKFHRLKLLVLKSIKASHKKNSVRFDLFDFGVNSYHVHLVFSGIKKSYHASKLTESLAAKEANIRSAIDRRIESFETNKGYTIRSVLKHPFYKVVLNHLVVDNKLVLEPDLVKSKFSELLDVVFTLPDGKAAGLLGITNKLWKHCNRSILDMLLKGVFTNTHSIALIETAYKILSKILSDKISLAYIRSVVEDVLEKNQEL